MLPVRHPAARLRTIAAVAMTSVAIASAARSDSAATVSVEIDWSVQIDEGSATTAWASCTSPTASSVFVFGERTEETGGRRARVWRINGASGQVLAADLSREPDLHIEAVVGCDSGRDEGVRALAITTARIPMWITLDAGLNVVGSQALDLGLLPLLPATVKTGPQDRVLLMAQSEGPVMAALTQGRESRWWEPGEVGERVLDGHIGNSGQVLLCGLSVVETEQPLTSGRLWLKLVEPSGDSRLLLETPGSHCQLVGDAGERPFLVIGSPRLEATRARLGSFPADTLAGALVVADGWGVEGFGAVLLAPEFVAVAARKGLGYQVLVFDSAGAQLATWQTEASVAFGKPAVHVAAAGAFLVAPAYGASGSNRSDRTGVRVTRLAVEVRGG